MTFDVDYEFWITPKCFLIYIKILFNYIALIYGFI